MLNALQTSVLIGSEICSEQSFYPGAIMPLLSATRAVRRTLKLSKISIADEMRENTQAECSASRAVYFKALCLDSDPVRRRVTGL